MASVAPKPWTVEEFLAWERTQEERYEFLDGLIVRMMVGGTIDHNTIAGNIFATLRARLRGGLCRAFVENVKVRADGTVMYPDVVVTCVPVAPKDDVVAEPVVVVEVLSRSTAGFDRGTKWVSYQSVPSLAHYVLVSQDEVRVEVFSRQQQGGWDYRVLADPADALRLTGLGVEIALAEVYESTSLDPRHPA